MRRRPTVDDVSKVAGTKSQEAHDRHEWGTVTSLTGGTFVSIKGATVECAKLSGLSLQVGSRVLVLVMRGKATVIGKM